MPRRGHRLGGELGSSSPSVRSRTDPVQCNWITRCSNLLLSTESSGAPYAGAVDVGVDLGVEVGRRLRRQHQRRPRRVGLVEPAPPQVAREVDDLRAGRLGHLDVARAAHPGELGGDARRVGDVLEQVRADRVVEGPVGERHVRGVGVEERAADPGRGPAGALGGVLRAGVAVEQHVGAPGRLVAAADVEHEVVVAHRHAMRRSRNNCHCDIHGHEPKYGSSAGRSPPPEPPRTDSEMPIAYRRVTCRPMQRWDPAPSGAGTSSSSTGATPPTRRAAVRSATSRRWRAGSCDTVPASRSSAPPTRRRRPRRSSTACGTCAAATTSTVYLLGAAGPAAVGGSAGSTSSWTCRTDCRSSPGWRTRKPVVVLVHHVHREQWPVVFPGCPARSAGGSNAGSPRCSTAAASTSRCPARPAPSWQLGVDKARIAVVHNGTAPPPGGRRGQARVPTLVVVGRLVPHKQIEHAVDAVAALRADSPGLQPVDRRQRLVGGRPPQVRRGLRCRRPRDLRGPRVRARKHEILAGSWLIAPALDQGGVGLVVGEAGGIASRQSPTRPPAAPASRSPDQRSGCLVRRQRGASAAPSAPSSRTPNDRERLGDGASRCRTSSRGEHSQDSFARVLTDVLAGRRVSVEDPDGP